MAIESVDESIISKKAGLLVEPAIRQFRYMFGFNNFVEEFNERKQNLALALDRLQNAVDVAERNAEEIEKDVTKWLEDANNEINGLTKLENLRHIYIRECGGIKDGIPVVSFVTDGRGGHELSLRSLKTLYLNFLPDMRYIWKGRVLSNLTILEVNGFKRLTYVFTYDMIATLVQLKVLKTSSCEELEQIIAKDDHEKDEMLSGDHLLSLCFPSLCEIEVEECNKLKSLFPVAMASGIPELQILKITKASQFLGVFGQDDQAAPVTVEKEIVLSSLQELTLEQLPSIVCFSFGCCDFLFPCLEKLKVYECAKLSTKFAIIPDGSMSAQSEISQVAEDISINREWTRDNGWKEEVEEYGDDDVC